MPTSLNELVIVGGMHSLHCPATGRIVFDREDFDTDKLHSPHLRFFVDWIGQVWMSRLQDIPVSQRSYMTQIRDIWMNEADADNQNSRIEKCLQVLPSSAIVLEILDPPYGSFVGEICYACFDLATLEGKKRGVKLVELDSEAVLGD